jgi:hypothetical protein
MKRTFIVVALVVLIMVVGGIDAYYTWWDSAVNEPQERFIAETKQKQPRTETYVTEWNEYHAPPANDEVPLTDDVLAEKNPRFDETLVDSRTIDGWQVNASAAVVRLDSPMIKPDADGAMLVLRKSYSLAALTARATHRHLLPSANMLDGAAKQFDDGLYAALDLACFQGKLGLSPSAPDWAAAVLAQLPAASPARPFLAAALELAGKSVDLTPAQRTAKDRWLAEFEGNEVASKPIGFYDWTPELKQVFRFFRFLQCPFPRDGAVARDVAAVLKANAELLKQYRAINAFYGRLTNPQSRLPIDALIDAENVPESAKGSDGKTLPVAVFPPSTSRETELFNRMFSQGVPSGANLMAVLINRIRSGEVVLKPGPKDGWYQYQVYAIETLLLPAKGQERDKLLLTAAYKKRLVEAFKAMMTTRRETHVRQLQYDAKSAEKGPRPLAELAVRPQLRVEPCATFYLRTARAYAFLETFLKATVGPERLKELHGLKEGGRREASLDAELQDIARRFYGFYLLACEDIGMKPEFLDGEPVDREASEKAALAWLGNMASDADLACDTRVAVPIFVDPATGKVRLWANLGVRLAHVDATYARPPQVRPLADSGSWQELKPSQLSTSDYAIAVVEFAEIELPGFMSLSRQELRDACDRCQTKEEIVRALTGR